MIALQQTPGTIALSRNDMLFTFLATDDNTGAPYGAAGARSEFKMNGGQFAVGEQIIVKYTDAGGVLTSLTFTGSASPANNLEYQAAPGGLITDHYNAVLQTIGAHPDLAPFVSFTGVYGLDFVLNATSKDTNINIIVEWDVSGVASAFDTAHFAAAASTAPDGYQVLVDVMMEKVHGSGTFERVAGTGSGTDSSGMVFFNIKKIIDDEIRNSFSSPPIPVFGATEAYIADTTRNYYIRFRENWIGNTTSTWSNGIVRKALCGGISKSLFADYDFFSAMDATNSLLTWSPNGQTVSPDQPVWIAWYNYTGAKVVINPEVTTTNTANGQDVIFNMPVSDFPVEANEIIVIPVGYNQLGITGDIQRYSVFVKQDNGTQLSPTKTYYTDHSYYEEVRFIMYLNGLCLPETIRCIGEHSTDLQVSRSKSNHVLAPNYESLHSEVRQHNQDFINYFTYRTGFIRAEDGHALQEWLIYNDGYEIYEQGYIPLDIKGNKFSIVETRRTLNVFAITAKPRMTQNNYSNINIPLTATQTGWAIEGGDFWKTQFGTNWQIV